MSGSLVSFTSDLSENLPMRSLFTRKQNCHMHGGFLCHSNMASVFQRVYQLLGYHVVCQSRRSGRHASLLPKVWEGKSPAYH